MATQNYPEPNLQTVTSLDGFKPISINHTYKFGESLRSFAQALNITNLRPVSEGMHVELLGKPKVTLADGNVAEGDLIPLSHVKPSVIETKKITFKKYRKSTSGEAINTYGEDKAVNITDEALIKEIQNDIRKDLFGVIQNGKVTTNLNAEKGLQGALASVWGAVQTVFEDDTVTPVVFVHPMDVAQAIADKNLTLESAFGLNYYRDNAGVIVFTSTQVAKGTVYGTASENLVLAYISMSNSPVQRQFGLTADNSGFIGMTHFASHEDFTQQTLAVSGILLFPERLDGIVKVEIKPKAPGVGK